MKRHSGFTLIELLIALALIGMMVSLLFGALRFASKAWDASDARLERDTTITMLWQYLSDRFREARRINAHVQTEGDNYYFFQGEPDGVEFVAPMPATLGSGGLYIIRLVEGRVDGQRKLMLQRWFYHPDVLSGEADLPPWRPLKSSGGYRPGQEREGLRAWYSESALVDDLKQVRFRYYGIQEPGDEEADWSDRWDEEKRRLPLLVRMEVEDGEGAWPVMTFALPGDFQ